MRNDRTASTFKRAGLHKLECPNCPGYAYSTVANLESVGFPCCACGERMQPERLELALMLGVDSPIVAEYQRRTDRKLRAQMPAAKRPGQLSDSLADMGLKAAMEIVAEQRLQSRQRRIAAILPTPEALPF
jgi:hypothetical protein